MQKKIIIEIPVNRIYWHGLWNTVNDNQIIISFIRIQLSVEMCCRRAMEPSIQMERNVQIVEPKMKQ